MRKKIGTFMFLMLTIMSVLVQPVLAAEGGEPAPTEESVPAEVSTEVPVGEEVPSSGEVPTGEEASPAEETPPGVEMPPVEEKDGPDEGLTNTFYVPRSQFMSEYDYELYCERMYNQGYMDENYEWTPAAQNYIDRMTVENYNALDEDARAIVAERIENGEMKASDSPYITYEERERLLQEEQNNVKTPEELDSDTSGTDTETSDEYSSDLEGSTEMDPVVTATPTPEPEETSSGSPFRTIIIVVAVAIVLVGGFYIYRRQF